jgi:hypothetical protein
MLCRGDRVPARRVHHDDALFGGSGNIHIVQPYACSSHDLQVFGRFENFSGHRGATADDQAIVFPDFFHEILGSDVGNIVDFEAPRFKNIETFRRDGVAD